VNFSRSHRPELRPTLNTHLLSSFYSVPRRGHLGTRYVRLSGILSRVAPVRTDVSEEYIASIIRVIRIGGLAIALAVTNNRGKLRRNTSSPTLATLMMKAIRSSVTLDPTRDTRHNIPEDSILHSHGCENLKSYIHPYFCKVFHLSERSPAICPDYSRLYWSDGTQSDISQYSIYRHWKI
jgi:hypothetical protein